MTSASSSYPPVTCYFSRSLLPGGISKRRDQYRRELLIIGARAIISHAGKKQDALSLWTMQLRARKALNCTAVATAHKLARIMWV